MKRSSRVRSSLFLLVIVLSLSPKSPAELNDEGIRNLQIFDFFGAQQAFKAALDIDPQSSILRANFSIACLHLGFLSEVKTNLETILETHEKDPFAHFLLGLVCLREFNPAEAQPHFEAVLRIDPNDADTIAQLGHVKMQAEHWKSAARLFRQSLRLRPENPSTLYNLARALLFMGKADEARQILADFREARSKHPRRMMGGMGDPPVIEGKYGQPRRILLNSE